MRHKQRTSTKETSDIVLRKENVVKKEQMKIILFPVFSF